MTMSQNETRSLRVLIVLDHAHVNGGQAKVALDSAVGLARRGHAVTVFAAVAPVDPRLVEAGVRVVCLDQPDIVSAGSKMAFVRQVIWNGEAARRLRAHLAAPGNLPDLIHVHGWAKALSPSVAAVVARVPCPLIYTIHEYYLFCPNGGFYDYHAHEICHRTPFSPSCLVTNCDHFTYAHKVMRTVRTGVLTWISRLAQNVDRFIAISDLQEEIARRHLPKGSAISRLSNPIDAIDRGPKPAGAASGAPFLYAGRISPEKGLDTLLEAGRRSGLRIRIVGDGPEAAAKQAAYPEMDFAGWKKQAEVGEEMRSARALIFPSVWFEGQPLIVLEALASGTPVIVSDACAGRESIVHSKNGLWFRAKDVTDLSAALDSLVDDARVEAMSAEAYRGYWSQPLTLDRHLDGLEAIYAEVRAGAALRAA